MILSGSVGAAATSAAATATTTTAGSLLLRVVSYNVLSTQLARPEHFCRSQPEHLDAEQRFPKLLQKLQSEMDTAAEQHDDDDDEDAPASGAAQRPNQKRPRRHTVFCLQEVSYDWAGPLHAWFARRGYHVVACHYGRPFNGYMGVLTAYPATNVVATTTTTTNDGLSSVGGLETVAVDIRRCSDTYAGEWPEPEQQPPTTSETPSLFSKLWSKAASLLLGLQSSSQSQQQPEEDPWQLARRRFNGVVMVVVRCPITSIAVAIGNYHMPCAFYSPPAMTLHGDLCLAHVQRVAAKHSNKSESDSDSENSTSSIPYILAGDFNFKPGDPVYRLLTTGQLDADSPGFPPPWRTTVSVVPKTQEEGDQEEEIHTIVWKPTLREPVQSAYVAATGQEPDFTNYALTGDMEQGEDEAEPFVEPLDYIFVPPPAASSNTNIEVESVKKLPHRNFANGPYPNADEPSDHVLIAANVRVVAAVRQQQPQQQE